MLSYAEHGKFRLQTQEHRPFFPGPRGAERRADQSFRLRPFCGSVFRNVRRRQVDHDRRASAMALPIEEAAIRSLRRPDESTRVIETKIGWRFERKCPGLPRLIEGLQQLGNPTGATTQQT
jgi:hypothetical protein